MDDAQFKALLEHLGYCWAGYRKVRKGIKKRIHRHMQRMGCRDIVAYLNLLEHQAASRYECELLMTVSISRFFRDRHLWQMLENRWLPDIIAKNRLQIGAWSAGCACGEEVYSFKIVWQRLKTRFESLPPLQVLATDRHPQYIERARSGIYNRSSLREVAAVVRTGFFESRKGSKLFEIKAELKGDIHWETGHLLTESPGSVFHIIFLRNNILTYCRQEDQIRALESILNCLAPGGLFITGCHETLPVETGVLIPMAECRYVYKKK
ncbi:Chemotaxis protein methyltransferase CheR (EC [Olavius sp. associated proteobacterium Delta 1]|nr:Chemotaxis protein methyltransferase CheR (EC [Olavius sp. associated proteobacterium Delta 1]